MDPGAGVPAKVAVPLPLSVKVTPLGNVPVSESEGAGVPEAVTVKVPDPPSVKVALLPDVMAGGVEAEAMVVVDSGVGGVYGGVPLPSLLLVGYPSKLTFPAVETLVLSLNSVRSTGSTVPTAPVAVNDATTVGMVTVCPPATSIEDGSSTSM